ncbi:MAG: type II toxin-antitoxin system HicB family antitoxin [Clostridiales bacterium]|nr:type II toxin-antitoxin system HicB family antitoxin [Clostridiales bacterium]
MTMRAKTKSIEDYMALGYPFIVVPFHEDGFVGYRAFLLDIPAVESLGTTPEEALHDLDEAKREWLSFALKKGIAIPEPNVDFPATMAYSGRVTLRISKTLHRQASERAHMDGISLNSYLNEAIRRGIERT